MSSSDERVEALAKAIADAMWERGWVDSLDAQDAAPEVARALLDSPAMRDLLAEERAKALREAADQSDTLRGLVRTSALVVMAEVGETNKALATAIGGTAATSTARWLRTRADKEVNR